MIQVSGKEVVLTGMHFVLAAGTKNKAGQPVQGMPIILSKKHQLAEPVLSSILTAQPHALLIANTTLVAGTTTIEGTVYPVGSTVYVSHAAEQDKFMYNNLSSKILTSTKADETGKFTFVFEDQENNKGVTVWTEISANFAAASQSSLDIKVTYSNVVEPEPPEQPDDPDEPEEPEDPKPTQGGLAKVVYSYRDIQIEDSTIVPIYILQGQCPSDVSQVYVSIPTNEYSDDTLMLVELQNTIIPDGGTIIVDTPGFYYKEYTEQFTSSQIYVWCVSKTSTYITADYTCNAGTVNPVCLAGHTKILMSDGTEKELRYLTVDDEVMGGNGKPTLVTKWEESIESDYHTLYHFDNGVVIDEAHRHRFFNVESGYWKYLDEWKLGEHAKKWDGTITKLVNIEIINEPCRRYGLWTTSHDYFANGLLSGETAANQKLLSDATLLQASEMLASLDSNTLDKLYKGEIG